MKILALSPVRDKPCAEFVQSVMALDGIIGWVPTIGKFAPDGRNALTAMALAETDADAFLWLDDDMVFPSNALERLLTDFLEDGHAILGAGRYKAISGLYYTRRPPWHAAACRLTPGAGPDGALYPINADAFSEYDTAVTVDACGAGFFLVSREALKTAGPDPWNVMPPYKSDDYSFCARLRAAGVKIAVHLGVEIGHIGQVTITRQVARALRELEAK